MELKIKGSWVILEHFQEVLFSGEVYTRVGDIGAHKALAIGRLCWMGGKMVKN